MIHLWTLLIINDLLIQLMNYVVIKIVMFMDSIKLFHFLFVYLNKTKMRIIYSTKKEIGNYGISSISHLRLGKDKIYNVISIVNKFRVCLYI
jgi:hypothetical protein